MTSHTAALNQEQVKKLREYLLEHGFEFIEKEHAVYAARKKKLSITVYHKGPKVLVQGGETKDFVEFVLEPQIIGQASLGYEEVIKPELFTPHIGVDESGKGDYLGPLVIAGVYTEADTARYLLDAGVCDSKKISSSEKFKTLAAIIKQAPNVAYHVLSISPQRYNELYEEMKNLNKLLAWGHATVIANLHQQRPDCPRALSDQFANPRVLQAALAKKRINIHLEQKTKAESDIAVAAASILARAKFEDWMEKTSQAGGVKLPFGGSSNATEAARKVMKKHGDEALKKVAKIHFKNTKSITPWVL